MSAPTPFATAATLRKVSAWALSAASVALSYLTIVQALQLWRLTDADLLVQFRGQSYEDLLGFGFWPTWAVTAMFQTIILFCIWVLMRPSQFLRPVATLLVGAFIAASIFNHQQVARTEHLLGFHGSSLVKYAFTGRAHRTSEA